MNDRDVDLNSEDYPLGEDKVKPISDKKGLIPGSIVRTLKKIIRVLKPGSSHNYTVGFHIYQRRTRVTIRFLAILIIAPALVQSLSHKLLIAPTIKLFYNTSHYQVILNSELEVSKIKELKNFERKLKFRQLISTQPEHKTDNINREIQDKAKQLSTDYQQKAIDSIANIYADIVSLITFAVVIIKSKREIAIAKCFLDDIVYGLSDSAKAFLIILFTDVFVGFHSPHGWEVIVKNISEHLGIVFEKNIIGIFIATFPVILDTIFKYWVFRYLSRLSPSALATFKEMNE